MDDRLITLLSALSGIAFGWALTQFSNWYKERKDDNRIRKAAIFHLLEIGHTLRKMSKLSPDYSRKVLLELKKLDIKFNDSEVNGKKIENEFNTILRAITREHIYKQVKLIGPDYENAIISLSPIEPIIAFGLKGRSNVIEQIDHILKRYIKEISKRGILPPEEEKQADDMLKMFMENTLYFDTINTIESHAIELGKQVGTEMKEKVEGALKINAQIESQDEIRKMAELFYTLIPKDTER